MKRRIYVLNFACLIILCFLCSCSTGKSNTASNIPPINCEYSYFNYVVSGEDGYYLLCDGLIGFWDGNISHKATPLCKRPDCSHRTEECTAFISGAYMKMFYIDGGLYLFSSIGHKDPVTKAEVRPLWRVAADGSSKEPVLYVNGFPQIYTIFQDTVYYESYTKNENGKSVSCIYSKPLKGGEEVMIWESGLQSSGAGNLQGIGDRLYFGDSGYDLSLDINAPDFDFDSVEIERNFYTYQPETGELLKNPEFDGKNGKDVIFRNIYEGKLYYSYGEELEKEFWCKPLDGEEPGEFAAIQPFEVNKADSDYIYTFCIMNSEQRASVKALDYEGNLVQEFPMPHAGDDIDLYPSTEDYIFGYYFGLENGILDPAIIVIERDKIAEGKAEMIRIFENK